MEKKTRTDFKTIAKIKLQNLMNQTLNSDTDRQLAIADCLNAIMSIEEPTATWDAYGCCTMCGDRGYVMLGQQYCPHCGVKMRI